MTKKINPKSDIETKIVVDYYAKDKKYIMLSNETLEAIKETEEFLQQPEKHQFYSSVDKMFEDVLEKNISANPDLPAEFVKDILIAKDQPKKPFDMELEE